MWECSNCHEQIEDQFALCWKCGSDTEGKVAPDFILSEPIEPEPEEHYEAPPPTTDGVTPFHSHWRDERSGIWTSVELGENQIVIALVPTYLRGFILLVILVAAFLIYFIMHDNMWATVIFSIFLLPMVKTSWNQLQEKRKRFPILIARNADRVDQEHANARLVCIDEIKSMTIRENLRRNQEDSPLFQIYLHLENSLEDQQKEKPESEPVPLLIHQKHAYQKEATHSLGDTILNWIQTQKERS